MPTYLTPGVYVEEIPAQSKPIARKRAKKLPNASSL